MSAIIDKLKANALSFRDLQYMVGKKVSENCRWLMYDELKHFKNIEQLMQKGAVVLLLEIENKKAPPVGHFIILLDHGTHYEHFDSYGLNMDEELKLTQEHHLTNLFKNSDKKIVNNKQKLQMFREDINTCGRFVVGRLLMKSLELEEFIAIFNHLKPKSPDEIITCFTLLLTYDK